MPAHSTRAVALVKAAVDLFGRKAEAREFTKEGASGVQREGERSGGREHRE